MYDRIHMGQQLGIDISSLSHDVKLTECNLMNLMRTLMLSTGNYICSRIESPKHKEAYKLAMDQYIDETKRYESLEELSVRHGEIIANVKAYIKPTWYSSRAIEHKYYRMACHHAADIINSIDLRFRSGGSDSESRRHRHAQPIATLSNTKLFTTTEE